MNTEIYARVCLKGMSGGYRDSEYFLDDDVFQVGRAPGSDLVLKDRTISGRHARIVHRVDGYWMEDLNSTNGTFVNGHRVDRQRLRTGDRIAFDKLEFIFKDSSDVPRTTMAEATDGNIPTADTSPRPRVIPSGNARVEVPISESAPRDLPSVLKNSSLWGGRVLGLLLAFLVGYTGILAAFLAGAGSVGSAAQWLRGTAMVYPRLYLHPAWMGTDFSPALVLGLGGILLAPFLGGFVAWRLGRGSRTISALWFAVPYALIAAVGSLAESGFRFPDWIRGFPAVVPAALPAMATAGVGIVYMTALCFVLALLGSSFSR